MNFSIRLEELEKEVENTIARVKSEASSSIKLKELEFLDRLEVVTNQRDKYKQKCEDLRLSIENTTNYCSNLRAELGVLRGNLDDSENAAKKILRRQR